MICPIPSILSAWGIVLFRLMNRGRGFTLIELIAVVAIMTILAVAASIPILSIRCFRVDGAANKLMYDIQYAQQLAINRQVPCGIYFDFGGECYFVYIGDINTKAKDPLTGEDLIVNYNTDPKYKGVNLFGSNIGDRIWFDYMGVPYQYDDAPFGPYGGCVSLRYGETGEITGVLIETDTGRVKCE